MDIDTAKTKVSKTDKDGAFSTELLNDYLAKVGAYLIPIEFLQKQLPDLTGQFPTLFYRGHLDILKYPSVSVVGTRNPTLEGIARTKRVAALLVELGFVVISGLAKGIDTVAHRTTLEHGGKTTPRTQ